MNLQVARGKLSEGNTGSPSSAHWKLRKYCDRRRATGVEERSPYMSDWMNVSDYVDPTRGRWTDGPNNASTEGSKAKRRSRAKIIDNTATMSVRTAAAGFASHMTSKSRPWFQIETPDPELNDAYGVRVWNDNVTDAVRWTLAKSNFYKAIPDGYTEDMMFGTMAMLMPEHEEDIVRFHVLTAGTYWTAAGADGKIDTLGREYNRTARQIVQQYGKMNPDTGRMEPDPAKMPERLCREWKAGKVDTKYALSSMFEPNPDAKPGLGPLGLQAEEFRPWRELVWISGSKDDKHGCLIQRGYYEQPFVVGRMQPVGDEIWSNSPCVDSLGDIKGLQYTTGQKMKVGDQMAEPPLALPDLMRNEPVSLAPRSKIYVPINQLGVKAEPLYVPNPNAYTAMREDAAEIRARVQSALFYPLFMMLASLDDRERTLGEINARRDELATVLGPTVEAITDEVLDPVIVRVFRVMERRGMIPPAPPELANRPLKIEYTSILAQAMKSASINAIERTIGFAANLVAITKDPSHFDKIDVDQALDEFSVRAAAPASIIRSDEAVEQIRAGRAQQNRAAALAQLAPAAKQGAEAAATLATTVPEDGSIAENMQNAMAGAQ